MGKIAKASLAFLAVATVIGAFNGKHPQDTPPSSDTKPAPEAKTDYYKPLITGPGTLVCPVGVLFDRREGHGIQDAANAQLSFIGHDEAVAKAGCQNWKEGIPVEMEAAERKKASDWQEKGECIMVAFSDGLIFTCNLKNSSTTKPAPNTASVPTPPAADHPPAGIGVLIAREESLNDKCRDGSGDNPETAKPCVEREALVQQLKSDGWCYGTDDQAMSDRKWQPCAK
jgi:hypothetical protein